jgi:hypothetical protein
LRGAETARSLLGRLDEDAERPSEEDPLLVPPLLETALPVLPPLLPERVRAPPELWARAGASNPCHQAGNDGDEDEEEEAPIDPSTPPVLEPPPPLALPPPESPPPRETAEPPPLSPPLRETAEPEDVPVSFGLA